MGKGHVFAAGKRACLCRYALLTAHVSVTVGGTNDQWHVDQEPEGAAGWRMRGSRARAAAAALALLQSVCLLGGLAGAAAEHAAASEQGCPDTEQGRALAQAARQAGEAPFLFRKQRQDICPGSTSERDCAHPLPYRWAQFCEFDRAAGGGWAAYLVCDEAKQASVIDYYRGKAAVPNLDAMLVFSPCQLWPLIRGRTLWVVGDSHSYDLFHAAACFLAGLWDHGFEGKFPFEGEEEGFAHLEAHVEHYKPPECLALAEGTLVCQVRVQNVAGHAAMVHVPEYCCATESRGCNGSMPGRRPPVWVPAGSRHDAPSKVPPFWRRCASTAEPCWWSTCCPCWRAWRGRATSW